MSRSRFRRWSAVGMLMWWLVFVVTTAPLLIALLWIETGRLKGSVSATFDLDR